VIVLITAVVTTQFSEGYVLLEKIILGLVVSLLFLASVTIRELILSTAAFRRETLLNNKITVYAFGGVYPEHRDRIVSTHVPLLYIARYLSNLVISVIFYGLYATFINADNLMLAGLAQWLAYIFCLFFLLHFIPAFPLDGGQILRMSLWKSSNNYYKATQIASLIGWVAGLLMIFAGVLDYIFTQQWMLSLMIVIVGWIIVIAAGDTRWKIKILIDLQGVRAQDVMTREYPVMSPQINIGQLVNEHILVKGWHYVIVMEGTQLKGFLTVRRIKSVPWKRWNTTMIGDILTPFDQLKTACPLQTADTVLDEMDQRRLDYMPVLEGEHIAGVVTREALMSLVKTRTSLGA